MTAQIGMGVHVTGAASSAAQIGRVGDSASRAGDRLRKMGNLAKAGGLALAAGAGAAAAGLYSAVEAAGDLGETVSKTNAIFGAQGGAQLAKWAGENERALGQSRQTALDAAATFGTFGKAAGLAGGDLVKFAQNNTQLATDMASFSNTSPEEAIEAIGAAFRGEAEPMRSYGVLLDDATLRQTALRLGLVKTTKEALTPQQKVLAAQSAILKQTKDAQGDFARTSGGLAGQQKILTAQIANTKVELGSRFLPVLTRATTFISKDAIPGTEKLWKVYKRDGIDGLVKRVERLTGTQGELSPILDEVALAGESVWRIVRDLAPVFADAASQVPPILSPLQAAGDILDVVADAVEAIPDPIKSIGVQAGIAALILPRLTGAVAAGSTAMMVGTTRAIGYATALRSTGTAAQTRAIGQMAGAARQAAGIGGVMGLSYALNKASDEGNSFGSVMTGAAGGAGIGMMFGPIGALIGAGVGGGLSALVGSFHETASEAEAARLELLKTEGFKNAREDADSLRAALLGVRDAYGETVRASVEAKFFKDGKLEGDISNLRNLGVSMDTIVSATLGQADAQGIVNKALDGGVKSLKAQADSARSAYEQAKKGRDLYSQTGQVIGKENLTSEQLEPYKKAAEQTAAALKEAAIGQETFNRRVGENGAALQDRREKIRGLAKDLHITAQQYLNFPDEVRTKFEARDLPQTSSDALRLIRNYKELQRFGRIRAIVSAPGVDLTRGQINRLARQYKLTPKQVRTLMRAEGVESTVRDVRRVSKAVSDTKKAKPDLSGYERALAHHMGDFRNTAERGGRDITTSLQKAPRKARLTMPGVAPSVRSGLGPAKSAASSGGASVGSNIKYGFMGGFAGAAAEWAAATRGATRAAVNAARDEADIHSPSRKTHKIGKQMVEGASLAFEEGRSKLSAAGRNLIRDLVKGIDHEKASATRVLAAVGDEVERTTNRVQKLQQLRASYVSDFRGFSSSVFAAQAPTSEDGTQGPQTVGNLLSVAADEAAKAKRVQAAIKKLTGKGGLGLSADLIKQLRSQGAGGIDQILALADGSRQDIRRLNSYNKTTNGAYTATGLGLFQQQGGNSRLAQAQHDQRVAESVAREVRRALQGLKIEGGQFRLEGTTLIAAVKATQRKNGK